MREGLRKAGVETAPGCQLHRTFVEAGLPQPKMALETTVAGGSDAEVHEWLASTIRSMLTLIGRFGIATETEVDIETLAERLQAETAASGRVLKLPDLVSAHARTER